MSDRKATVREILRVHQLKKKPAFEQISRFLISKGLFRSLSEQVTLHYLEKGEAFGSLQEILQDYLTLAGDLPLSTSEPLFVPLIGPTGVGKTTSILKLIEFYREKCSVGVLSMDREKRGAYFQFEAAGVVLSTKKEELLECDLVFVDTTGCNYYLSGQIDRLGAELAELPKRETILTLSAAAKDVDLFGAIHQFSSLEPSSLLFTKLDETLTLGTLFNTCQKTRLPLRYIAYGYPLPGIIHLADSEEITKKVLADFNQQEFHKLRQITLEC